MTTLCRELTHVEANRIDKPILKLHFFKPISKAVFPICHLGKVITGIRNGHSLVKIIVEYEQTIMFKRR